MADPLSNAALAADMVEEHTAAVGKTWERFRERLLLLQRKAEASGDAELARAIRFAHRNRAKLVIALRALAAERGAS